MINLLDRQRGCLLGLAIGDALGMPAEFMSVGQFEPITNLRSGGPFDLQAGEWTDDTSMALCLADSIIANDTIDPVDLHGRFLRWMENGENSHNGRCFDIGTITRRAILKNKGCTSFQFPSDFPDEAGNGSIMRLAPVAIRWVNEPKKAIEMAILQGQVTHGNCEAIVCCELLCSHLIDFMNGQLPKIVLPTEPLGLPSSQISATGYCVDTLYAAQWAIVNTDNFRDALLLAVNLGNDSDTVGAVTGQLAGALYGISGIPISWLNELAWKDHIDEKAIALANMGRC